MDPTKAIVLKTFPNTTAAGFAASQLRSRGIDCLVTSDDAGGMYPPLGLIKLLVDPMDAEAAREYLESETAPPEPLAESFPEHESSKAPPPRVARFNSGLIIGAILGALLYFSYTRYEKYRDRTYRYDDDQDGVSEQEIIWKKGKLTEARYDRNGDGRWDSWTFYKDEVAWRGEEDDNFDGRVDGWLAYSSKGFVSHGELDTDYNGVRDVNVTYTNGLTLQMDWKPNGTNVVLLRQFFQRGVLREELRDANGDGLFDVRIQFDAFSTPIATNVPNLFSPLAK